MVYAYPNVPARFHHRRRCQRSRLSTIPDVVVIRGNSAISIFFSLSRFHSTDTLPCFADPTTCRETTAGIARTALQPTPSATESRDPVVPRMRSALNGTGPLNVEKNCPCPQFSFLELGNEPLKAGCPSGEVFIGAEFDQSCASATGRACCTTR